jgi:hypothetical protein
LDNVATLEINTTERRLSFSDENSSSSILSSNTYSNSSIISGNSFSNNIAASTLPAKKEVPVIDRNHWFTLSVFFFIIGRILCCPFKLVS